MRWNRFAKRNRVCPPPQAARPGADTVEPMHRYNNQDYSMLTAMTAVDYIPAGRTDKGGLWEIDTEMD